MTTIIMRVDLIHDNKFQRFEARHQVGGDDDREISYARAHLEATLAMSLKNEGKLWNSAIGPLQVEILRDRNY